MDVLVLQLVLAADRTAVFLGGERLKEATDFTGPGSSRQGSFSPQEGQNLNSGCSFDPHWGQKRKGILQESKKKHVNIQCIHPQCCLVHNIQYK